MVLMMTLILFTVLSLAAASICVRVVRLLLVSTPFPLVNPVSDPVTLLWFWVIVLLPMLRRIMLRFVMVSIRVTFVFTNLVFMILTSTFERSIS